MLVAVTVMPSLGTLACQAGELDDRQEQYLRKQLDKHYPNTGAATTTEPATETSAGPDSERTETTEPTATSSDAVVTSEALSSTAAANSTETSDSSSTPDTGAGQIPDCAIQVFQTACAGNVCHYQGAINLPPNFETDEDLFTMLTVTGMTGCDGAPSPNYVDLANPQNSYLLLKVRGEQPSGCGTPMPPEQTMITQEQKDCLEDWIGSL